VKDECGGIGVVACMLAALWIQLFVSVVNGWMAT